MLSLTPLGLLSALIAAHEVHDRGWRQDIPAALLLRNMSKAIRPVLSQEAPTLQVVANNRKLGKAALS